MCRYICIYIYVDMCIYICRYMCVSAIIDLCCFFFPYTCNILSNKGIVHSCLREGSERERYICVCVREYIYICVYIYMCVYIYIYAKPTPRTYLFFYFIDCFIARSTICYLLSATKKMHWRAFSPHPIPK